MKWKTNGDPDQKPETNNDPYYEDDGYASLKEKGLEPSAILPGNAKRYLYWGVGVVAVVGGVVLLAQFFSPGPQTSDVLRMATLERRIEGLEQYLQKYDGVDEKVTRIWEQAQSFENFKTRFDRSEASMSLRMDHLAKSLDALQKKTDEALGKLATLDRAPPTAAVSAAPPPAQKPPAAPQTAPARIHTVVAGDTLFSISQRYNVSVEQLRSLNQLAERDVIVVGQKLTVSAPVN